MDLRSNLHQYLVCNVCVYYLLFIRCCGIVMKDGVVRRLNWCSHDPTNGYSHPLSSVPTPHSAPWEGFKKCWFEISLSVSGTGNSAWSHPTGGNTSSSSYKHILAETTGKIFLVPSDNIKYFFEWINIFHCKSTRKVLKITKILKVDSYYQTQPLVQLSTCEYLEPYF